MKLINEPSAYNPYEYNFFPSKGTGLNRNFKYLSEYQRAVCKKELVDEFNRYDWSYFVTLTFRYDVKSEVDVAYIFRMFINKLSASAYTGRSKKRIRVMPVLERFDSGRIHIHFLMEDVVSRIPNPEKARSFNVRYEVIKAWTNCHVKTFSPLCATSKKDMWFKEVYSTYDVLNYMLKDIEKGSDPLMHEELSLEGRRFN